MKVEEVKNEFSAASEASDIKLNELTCEMDRLSLNVMQKNEEINQLNDMIQKREKETADEWIQRETAIMAQVAAEKQQTHLEYESRLREVYSELEAVSEKADVLKKERDAAKDDVVVFQVI